MVVSAYRNDKKAVEIQNFDTNPTGFPHSFSTFQQMSKDSNVENNALAMCENICFPNISQFYQRIIDADKNQPKYVSYGC